MTEVRQVIIGVRLPRSPLVSASRILTLGLAAVSDHRVLLIHLSAAVREVQLALRQTGHRVFVMCDSVRAWRFRVSKLGESFVANTRLAKVVHGDFVACCY